MSSIENKNETSSNVVPNGTSSNNPSEKNNKSNTEANGETIGDQPSAKSSNATAATSSKDSSDINGNVEYEPLKIIGHIKNIEKINEKRRIFLTNTLTETVTTSSGSSNEKTETAATTKTTTKTEEKCETNIDNSSHDKQNDVQRSYNEEHTIIRETNVDTSNGDRKNQIVAQTASLPPLKSPLTPPPKPPMLSRTRSLGIGDQRPASIHTIATPPTPTNTPTMSLPPQSPKTSPTSPTTKSSTATAATIPSSGMVVAVHAEVDSPVLLRAERPASILPDALKQISINHYERLIEELKCPGCATPMKAPIMLCQTGHSICCQCTRVLMMCPLCKEPFTPIRSRTVEALCAKAHFRCRNAPGGCNVRLQTDLLSWHEKQCIYKPMKCFMGRVWGDCQWNGREAGWKDHLEAAHGNRLFKTTDRELIWNMGVKQKPLTGYYVFDVFDELFNFYEIYDNSRVLFTMTCTSTVRERKHHFAYEVTIIHPDNEALAITQKFPVHSEYDKDILADGTCVSISLADLAKFIDDEKLLHYRVRLLEVKTPRKVKNPRYSMNPSNGMHPIDFQQTQIEGANLKGVPKESIVTRRADDIPFVDNAPTPSSVGTELEAGAVGLNDEDVMMRKRYYSNESVTKDCSSESDPEFEAYIAKKWGTPQMHFNRKYLKNSSPVSGSSASSGKTEVQDKLDDKTSITSRRKSYAKKMTNTLRKSFRSLKTPIAELKPLSFVKRSPEKKSP